MDARINALLELIGEVVVMDGTWREKKDAILAQCDDSDRTNLQEFITWFEDWFEEETNEA